MSVVLFTTPRPFEGHYEIIQTNALRSWAYVDPPPSRVLVFADRKYEGDAAVDCVENIGYEVCPILLRTPRGVPLLSDLFPRAGAVAEGGIACYVNADIILESDLVPALERCAALVEEAYDTPEFRRSKDGILMVARRWNTQVLDYMDFEPGWESDLKQKVDDQGSLMVECAIDLFAWKGEVWSNVKPYAIGRYRWDNWLIGNALVRNNPVIDVSSQIRITHQSHANVEWDDPDAKENFKIVGAFCGLKDSTHTLTEDGLVEGWLG